MQWVRDAGWIVGAVAVVVVLVMRPKPTAQADLDEAKALIAKHRAEAAERQATREKEMARIKTNGTLSLMRIAGEAYRSHLKTEKAPPQATDFAGLTDLWQSSRDEKPFEFAWGVDLAKLPDGGTGHVLAWEQTADADGSRCVLLADGKTAKVVTGDEFQKLPKAK